MAAGRDGPAHLLRRAPRPSSRRATIEDALLYGMRHAQRPSATPPGRYKIIKSRGNSLDFEADWVDYAAAGATGPEDIGRRDLTSRSSIVDLENDIVSFGLNRRLADMWARGAERFVEARAIFREQARRRRADAARRALRSRALQHAVLDRREPDLRHADRRSFNLRQLGSNPVAAQGAGRTRARCRRCSTWAARSPRPSSKCSRGCEADSPLFEQLSLMAPEQFPDYQAALKRVGTRASTQAAAGDQAIFLDLAFGYIEPRDRLGLLDRERIDRCSRRATPSTRRSATTSRHRLLPSRPLQRGRHHQGQRPDGPRRLRHRRSRSRGSTRIGAGHHRRPRPAAHRVRGRPRLQHRQRRQAAQRRAAPEARPGPRLAAPARHAAGASRR